MTGAYDCNYDFVDDPKQALVEAHEAIRELESQHADEIERLQNELYARSDEKRGVANTDRATLTAEEREAIEWYASFPDGIHADTLRKLLERMK